MGRKEGKRREEERRGRLLVDKGEREEGQINALWSNYYLAIMGWARILALRKCR